MIISRIYFLGGMFRSVETLIKKSNDDALCSFWLTLASIFPVCADPKDLASPTPSVEMYVRAKFGRIGFLSSPSLVVELQYFSIEASSALLGWGMEISLPIASPCFIAPKRFAKGSVGAFKILYVYPTSMVLLAK